MFVDERLKIKLKNESPDIVQFLFHFGFFNAVVSKTSFKCVFCQNPGRVVKMVLNVIFRTH